MVILRSGQRQSTYRSLACLFVRGCGSPAFSSWVRKAASRRLRVTGASPLEDGAELRGAGCVASSADCRLDHGLGEAVQDLSLVAGLAELLEVEAAGEVHDGSRHRGRGNAAVDGDVGRLEPPNPMGDHSTDPPVPSSGYLRRGRPTSEEAIVVRGGPAAENRRATTGENSGQVMSLCAASAVADPVNASIDTQQRATSHPSSDRVLAEAGLLQLLAGDHSVLAACDPRNVAR
jgi:hypothetical protein